MLHLKEVAQAAGSVPEERPEKIPENYLQYIRKKTAIIGLLALLTVVLSVYAINAGSAELSFNQVLMTLLGKEGSRSQVIIWNIRLPRIIAGVAAGTVLSVAGCVMQNILRNPLAEPYVLGVSGGAKGARSGPSLMPGGPPEAYARVQPILEAAAAKVRGEPCVAYLGSGSAGHYVKMVHNGIEYALMELLAEAYDLLRRGLGLSLGEMAGIYEEWQQGELASYLVEITPPILRRVEEKTGQPLVDLIQDQARQKGTGLWTSREAMDLQVPTPTIDAAVMMRALSGHKAAREAASRVLQGPSPAFQGDRQAFIRQLGRSLYNGTVLAFAQGLALLQQASRVYDYHLELSEVARIWRGGCIIRAAVLEDIRAAYRAQPDLPHLLLDPHLVREVTARMPDLRAMAAAAAALGLPAPGLMASLAYYDAWRSARLPANLIQAQRDYFGAHTYQRTDLPGAFHTHWEED